MSNTVVTFESTYGSTRDYAEELAERLNTQALSYEDAKAALVADPEAAVIVLGPVHGPSNAGVDFIKSTPLEGHRVALCTVGMTLDEVAVAKDGAKGPLGDKAEAVTRFYLPGRMNYSELSQAHRSVMWTVVKMLKMKPKKNDNDRMMIETFDTDVDRVDFSRLDPVVDWAHA